MENTWPFSVQKIPFLAILRRGVAWGFVTCSSSVSKKHLFLPQYKKSELYVENSKKGCLKASRSLAWTSPLDDSWTISQWNWDKILQYLVNKEYLDNIETILMICEQYFDNIYIFFDNISMIVGQHFDNSWSTFWECFDNI